MNTVDLNSSPTYRALSYCWGDPGGQGHGSDDSSSSNQRHISVNGRVCFVGRNLHEALENYTSSTMGRGEAVRLDKRYPPYNKTELIRAAEEGRLSDVTRQLELGHDVRCQDCFGETALHYAAENGHLAIVEALLRYGAAHEALDGQGRTPLACCLQWQRRQHIEVAKVLGAAQPQSEQPGGDHFRRNKHQPESDKLWIDALCIDQANLTERNAQVRLMSRIYKDAQSVVGWLGIEDHNTAAAFDLISKLGKLKDGKPYVVHMTAFSGLGSILRRRWFTRK